MSYNPYSDETVKARAETYPPMDELQLKQPMQVYAMPTSPVTDTPRPPEQTEAQGSQLKAKSTKFAIGKFNDYLSWFVMVLETMLALRFLFRLIGADLNNPFFGFLYALTSILLFPFENIVGSPVISSAHQNAVQLVEFPTLIGMLVYFLFYYALRRFFHLLISRPEDEAAAE